MTTDTSAPKVLDCFAYLRISSPRQQFGTGIKRQHEMAVEYAAKRGLHSPTLIRDILSAHKGKHRERGGLGKFAQEVIAGRVPEGTILIVESMDRLSREEVPVALQRFLELINNGIEVVTIADERSYNRRSSEIEMHLMASLMFMARSYHESARKAGMQRKTWAIKRANLSDNPKPLTRRAPAWLRHNGTGWVVDEERRKIVESVFTELANGIGRDKIARRLNKAGIPPFGHGREWHGGTVQKLTDNQAVMGWLQPHRLDKDGKRIPDGDPVRVFPPIIEEGLFHRARKAAESRRQGPHNAGGRKGTTFSNIFTGMVFCAACGSPMVYRDRGKRSTPCLRCAGNRNGSCQNSYYPIYKQFEENMIQIFSSGLRLNEAENIDSKRIEDLIAKKQVEIQQLKRRIERLLDDIEEGSSRSAKQRLSERELELDQLEKSVEADRGELRELHSKVDPEEFQSALKLYRSRYESCTTNPDRYAVRADLHQRFKRVINRIRFDIHGNSYVTALNETILYGISACGLIIPIVSKEAFFIDQPWAVDMAHDAIKHAQTAETSIK